MRIVHIITGLGEGGAEAVLYRFCGARPESIIAVISLQEDDKYGPLIRALGMPVICLTMRLGRIRAGVLCGSGGCSENNA